VGDRWAFASGIGFVALFLAGIIVAGSAPTLESSTADVVAYFVDHRVAVLVSSSLISLGIVIEFGFMLQTGHGMCSLDTCPPEGE